MLLKHNYGAGGSTVLFSVEVLYYKVSKYLEQGILSALSNRGLSYHLLIFADDVMLFLKPLDWDIGMCVAILEDFGEPSSLRINQAKCVLLPIRCSPDQVDLLRDGLRCTVGNFPCRYLGLPLCLRKPIAMHFQEIVDGIANKLPTWKAASMDKARRLVIVLSVLCVTPIHAMMALDVPPKVITSVIKICRGFLWAGSADARGGQCAVAWSTVCTSKWSGGLGIPNLRWLNFALRARWLWLKCLDGSMPWAEFDLNVSPESRAIYQATVFVDLRDG